MIPRRSWFQRTVYSLTRTWRGPALLAVVVLAAGAWWIAPRQVPELMTPDAAARWPAAEIPLREFAWGPATALEAFPADAEGVTWSPDGSTAFFTLPRDGQRDLYSARRAGDGWSPPAPLDGLNSPLEDRSPVVAPDGSALYFASNRVGAQGFDLYRAPREGAGWGPPENLASVNSPRDDLDPAVLPDGRVVFASNRSGPQAGYDLYATAPDVLAGTWMPPTPLPCNDPRADDVTPAAAAPGSSLYFASNRRGRGAAGGFDLYRVVWNGTEFSPAAALGPAVNTPAHETRPATTAGGFALSFARLESAAAGSPARPAVFESRAVEVVRVARWDDSRLAIFNRVWPRALLLSAVVTALWGGLWYARFWTWQSLSLSRFILASLALHAVVLWLMWVTPLGEVVFEVAEKIYESVPVTQLFDDTRETDEYAGQQPYERVADIPDVAPEAASLPRAPVASVSPSQSPLVDIPRELARVAPSDRVEFVPVAPEAPQAPRPTEVELPRRVPRPVMELAEALPAELPEAEVMPAEVERPTAEIEVARTKAEVADAADLPRRTMRLPVARQTDLEAEEIPEIPEPEAADVPLAAVKKPVAQAAEEAELQKPVAGDAVNPRDPLPMRADVELARGAAPEVAETAITPASAAFPIAPRRPTALPAEVELLGPAEPQPAKAPQMARTARDVVVDAVQPETVPVAGGAEPAVDKVVASEVVVTRGAAALETAPADVPELPRMTRSRARPIADLATERVEESDALLPDVAGPGQKAVERLVARVSDPLEPAGTAPLTAPQSLSDGVAQPRRMDVGVTRGAETAVHAVRQVTDEIQAPSQPRRETPLVDDLRAVVALAASALDQKTSPLERRATRSDVETAASLAAPLEPVTPTEESRVVASNAPLERRPADLPAATVGPTSPDAPLPRRRAGDAPLLAAARLSDALDPIATTGPLRTRAPARAAAGAEDNVGMQAMFTLRQAETRREFIELFGGTDATEAAVNRGLEWFATHQNENGSWSLHLHQGAAKSDTAATGFALLPFLAAGHTPTAGKYQPQVAKALTWLVAQQHPNGDLLAKEDHTGHHMYAHGIAAIALCEAYGMSQQAELREPAVKALDYIVKAQNAGTGGWRYQPGDPGDTSVVGWQVMALKSGEMAGLPIPAATLDGARKWLASVEANKPAGGLFGYTGPSPTPTMTAEGLLCLQFMGVRRNDPRMRAGADFLLKHLPAQNAETSYYWYYGTQVMYHMQGDAWAAWNAKTRDLLVTTQIKDGPHGGTWEPTDSWEKSGGRVMSTSLKLLMLEVYYRHLPLYQQLEE